MMKGLLLVPLHETTTASPSVLGTVDLRLVSMHFTWGWWTPEQKEKIYRQFQTAWFILETKSNNHVRAWCILGDDVYGDNYTFEPVCTCINYRKYRTTICKDLPHSPRLELTVWYNLKRGIITSVRCQVFSWDKYFKMHLHMVTAFLKPRYY
jgi:hypothetical protein